MLYIQLLAKCVSKALWQIHCLCYYYILSNVCKYLSFIPKGWESNESKLPSKHGRRQNRICIIILWIPLAYTTASE